MRKSKLVELIEREPNDTIWQEAIALSDSIATQPDVVAQETWAALKEAKHEDTIAALATCLLEHLLEHDFSFFKVIEERVSAGDMKLLYALSKCSKFGVAKQKDNAARWDSLISAHNGEINRIQASYNSG